MERPNHFGESPQTNRPIVPAPPHHKQARDLPGCLTQGQHDSDQRASSLQQTGIKQHRHYIQAGWSALRYSKRAGASVRPGQLRGILPMVGSVSILGVESPVGWVSAGFTGCIPCAIPCGPFQQKPAVFPGFLVVF